MFCFLCINRRGSFHSSRSVPALTLEGRSSGRSTKSEASKLRRKNDRNKKPKQHSEVGIRTVHTAYKAHHGFLALLKQRFSRSSSRDRDGIGTREPSRSATATPEASRRPLNVDRPPEIVRIRNEGASASGFTELPHSVEILRHAAAPAAAGATAAATGAAAGAGVAAEVVRHRAPAVDQVRVVDPSAAPFVDGSRHIGQKYILTE